MTSQNRSLAPRERMRRAMDHREPDRVPTDFGSISSSSIAALAYEKLKRHLGIGSETRLITKQGQVAYVDEAILEMFHVDTRSVTVGAPEDWADIAVGPRTYQDEWGVQWQRTEESNSYFLLKGPFQGDENGTIEAIQHFRWPDPKDPGRRRGLREKARRLHEQTDYAVVFAVYPSAGFWAQAEWMRGFEDFYTDLVTNKKFIHALLDRILEVKLEVTQRVLAETKGFVDVMLAGDDLGTQDGPMISMQMYGEFVKPRQRILFEAMKKAEPDAKLLYHCDGCIDMFLPHLIEIGIEGLNPVQVSAKNMGDTARLKREFGKDLFFWGGIDTGRVLPFGTRDEVFEEMKRRIDDLGPEGGYVLAPVHNIQDEVPPENVCAMFEAAMEYGNY
ncbi:MAG: uroporphyrinogen decarboxylase family protein [Nitrospinota bacterium]